MQHLSLKIRHVLKFLQLTCEKDGWAKYGLFVHGQGEGNLHCQNKTPSISLMTGSFASDIVYLCLLFIRQNSGNDQCNYCKQLLYNLCILLKVTSIFFWQLSPGVLPLWPSALPWTIWARLLTVGSGFFLAHYFCFPLLCIDSETKDHLNGSKKRLANGCHYGGVFLPGHWFFLE